MLQTDKAIAKIASFNPRAEKHGEDNKLAADIKVQMSIGNSVLDQFHPDLRAALYRKAGPGEQQDLIDGENGLSMKREELIAWLQQQNGDWINADVKVSQGGKFYAQVDDWKPDSQRGGGHGGRRGGQEQRRPRQQSYEEVRDQRLGDLQRSTPMDDFADDDIPFVRWGTW